MALTNEDVTRLIQEGIQKHEDDATRGPRLKATEPDTFSGIATESPEDWFNRLNDYFNLSGVTNPKIKLTTFRLLLRGIALLWFDELRSVTADDEDQMTFDKVRPLFLARFSDASQQWLIQETLDSRRLIKGDDIDAFLDDMLRLAHKLKLSSLETANAIKRSLYPDLKVYIISCAPADLETLIAKLQMGHTLQRVKTVDNPFPLHSSVNSIAQGAGSSSLENMQSACDKVLCSMEAKLQLATDKAANRISTAAAEAANRAADNAYNAYVDPYTMAGPREDQYAPRRRGGHNYFGGRGHSNSGRINDFNRNSRAIFTGPPQGAKSDDRIVRECNYCNKKGHLVDSCWAKARDEGRPYGGRGRFDSSRGQQRGSNQSGRGGSQVNTPRLMDQTPHNLN
jgi:hypothetical protein